jgi:hypothetical protein
MSDEENNKESDIRLSPTPKYTAAALTQAIIETRQDTKFLREDLLPPLMKDTKEARDKAREALSKVDTHLADTDSHEHPCVEGPRQERQDEGLANGREVKSKVSGLVKILGIAITIVIGAIGGSYGYTLTLSNSTTANETRIEGQTNTSNRHEREINSLEKAQQQDRETYLREMRALPGNVQEVAQKREPTLDDVEDFASDRSVKMSDRERDMMKLIVKQVKKRSSDQL